MINFPLGCGFVLALAFTVEAFAPIISRPRPKLSRQKQLQASTSDELISLCNGTEEDKIKIKSAITSLEESFDTSVNTDNSDDKRFEPLIGLYKVQSVITANPKDNPVGGKWTRQKLFRTRGTFQHLLPFNTTGLSQSIYAKDGVAEAINVVSLDALNGLLRATVILRGDAVPFSREERNQMNANRSISTPLTNLVVRAYFDPPRIYFGKRGSSNTGTIHYKYLPLQLGPTSSVVLDTTYYDKLIRIGMGGTSGSRFVFTSTNTEEAIEYKSLLRLQNMKKKSLLAKIGAVMALSSYIAFGKGTNAIGRAATDYLVSPNFAERLIQMSRRMRRNTPLAVIISSYPVVMKILAGATSVLSGALALLVLFSSGGIERDDESRRSQNAPPN